MCVCVCDEAIIETGMCLECCTVYVYKVGMYCNEAVGCEYAVGVRVLWCV